MLPQVRELLHLFNITRRQLHIPGQYFLRRRTPKIHLEGLGSDVSSPSMVYGRAPSRNRIWCIIALKYKICWQQF